MKATEFSEQLMQQGLNYVRKFGAGKEPEIQFRVNGKIIHPTRFDSVKDVLIIEFQEPL